MSRTDVFLLFLPLFLVFKPAARTGFKNQSVRYDGPVTGAPNTETTIHVTLT